MNAGLQQTVKHLIAIALIGLVVGLTSSITTIGFVRIWQYLNELLFVSSASRASVDDGQLWLITIAVLTFGGLGVGLILRYGADDQAAAGPADTIYAIQLHEKLPRPLCGAASTVAAMLSLGCGASVGQFGPLVYLGTLVGQLGRKLSFDFQGNRNAAIACGVAAAISTGFNAPIAALIFTHEVVLRHYSLRMFTAVTVASACGYLVANVIFEHPPVFLLSQPGKLHGPEFLLFAIEGIACGILAVLFLKLLQFTSNIAQRIRTPQALKPMIAGFLMALVAIQVPEILGAGEQVFGEAIAGDTHEAGALLLILVAKLFVTVLCIGFGFAGGVIFPSMLIGVLFGALYANLVPELLMQDYSGVSTYAICGMVAVMSPVIGAPMTAVLLVFELTRSYEVTIAAMLAIVFANLIAYNWFGRSLYDRQLATRGVDLSMGRERAYLLHHKIAKHVTDVLPVIRQSDNITNLPIKSSSLNGSALVMVDDDNRYLGMVFQKQLQDLGPDATFAQVTPVRATEFNQHTSIWDAMETARQFIGKAIPVIDTDSGRYLGAIPEAVVIGAYLDAAQALRLEEHEG